MIPVNIEPQQVNRLPETHPVCLGIDQSLTATGIALMRLGHVWPWTIAKPEDTGAARLDYYYNEIARIVQAYNVSMVAMEGYAFAMGKNASKSHSLGELGGVIRLALWRASIPAIVVPPTTLKKFITSDGKTPKDQITKEVFKRYGVDVNDNNQADAVGLGVMAVRYLAKDGMFAYEQEGMKKVELLTPKPIVYRTRTRAA